MFCPWPPRPRKASNGSILPSLLLWCGLPIPWWHAKGHSGHTTAGLHAAWKLHWGPSANHVLLCRYYCAWCVMVGRAGEQSAISYAPMHLHQLAEMGEQIAHKLSLTLTQVLRNNEENVNHMYIIRFFCSPWFLASKFDYCTHFTHWLPHDGLKTTGQRTWKGNTWKGNSCLGFEGSVPNSWIQNGSAHLITSTCSNFALQNRSDGMQ